MGVALTLFTTVVRATSAVQVTGAATPRDPTPTAMLPQALHHQILGTTLEAVLAEVFLEYPSWFSSTLSKF